MPMFSVVIPCYNSSNTIYKTLLSVLNQSFTDFELVVVDDFSDDTDALSKIIDDFSDKGLSIKTLYSKEKLNGAGARNKGVEISSGEYIAFLDADDEWNADKLLKCQQLYSVELNKDKILYSSVAIVKGDKIIKKMPLNSYDPKIETLSNYIFGPVGFIQTSAIVIKKELFNNIKFDDRFMRHQDYDFCIRADYHGLAFLYIPEELVIYNIVDRSSAKKKGESTKYSKWWLEMMSPYLTREDTITYNAFKLPHKYVSEGRNKSAVMIFLINFCRTSLLNKKRFFKLALGKIKK